MNRILNVDEVHIMDEYVIDFYSKDREQRVDVLTDFLHLLKKASCLPVEAAVTGSWSLLEGQEGVKILYPANHTCKLNF